MGRLLVFVVLYVCVYKWEGTNRRRGVVVMDRMDGKLGGKKGRGEKKEQERGREGQVIRRLGGWEPKQRREVRERDRVVSSRTNDAGCDCLLRCGGPARPGSLTFALSRFVVHSVEAGAPPAPKLQVAQAAGTRYGRYDGTTAE